MTGASQVTYALTYQKATTPAGGPQPGTVALQNHIVTRWPATRTLGIYNNRTIRGSTSLSIHAEGRAVDIGVPITTEGEQVGNQIADWATTHAPQLGIQYLIWNQRSWRHDRGWRPYRGVSPHRDHLHIEQTREAAANITDADIATLNQIPRGADTREGFRYPQPIMLRPIISVANCPNGGVWALADNGDVYALGHPAPPYWGGPNDERLGRIYDVLGEPDSIIAAGNGYLVSTDLDYTYGYGA